MGAAFIHMPDVGIIEQRGANGFFSISYGSQFETQTRRIMAIIEAPTTSFPNDVYTVTPGSRASSGRGRWGIRPGARFLRLATNGNTFTAELQLTHGRNGTTDVYVDCTGETVAVVEVPHPIREPAPSAAGSFTFEMKMRP